jgi:hypothetical protein
MVQKDTHDTVVKDGAQSAVRRRSGSRREGNLVFDGRFSFENVVEDNVPKQLSRADAFLKSADLATTQSLRNRWAFFWVTYVPYVSVKIEWKLFFTCLG